MTDYDPPTRTAGQNDGREPNDNWAKPVRKLVVLPGMDGTGLLLNPFIESLGRRVDAQLFDYPTHVIQSYEEIISNVEAVLPSAGEDFAILAESFAGPIALWLAQKDIPGLRGLILVVTFAATPRHLLLQLTRVLPMERLLGLPIPCAFARRLMLGIKPPSGTLDRLCGVMHMVSPMVLASRLDEMRRLRLPQKVIDLPALYLQATKDYLLPDNAVDDIKTLVPRIEIRRVEGPHLVLDTQPKKCAGLVAGFLDSLEYLD
jgi:pimeloyl-ACP methyl ester carboxylesterase